MDILPDIYDKISRIIPGNIPPLAMGFNLQYISLRWRSFLRKGMSLYEFKLKSWTATEIFLHTYILIECIESLSLTFFG